MASKVFFGILLLVCISSSYVDGSKILMLCPAPSRSHHILCKGVTDTLVDNGHDVTLISAFATNTKKYTDISIPALIESQEKNGPGFHTVNMSQIEMIQLINRWQPMIIDIFYNSPEVKNLLNDKSQKFDLVIFEYFMNEVLIGFGVHYKCPVIALSSVSLMSWLATMTGNPLTIATVPNIFTTYTTNMSLMERVYNTLIAIVQEVMGKLVLAPLQKEKYEMYMPEESKMVPYKDLKKQISMVVVNSHPSVGIARPLLPNTIEIGGYHIAEPAPLPEDLKKVIESAKHGVIYFSMGSNLKSSEMDINMRKSILKALSTFKETVLWKFEEDLPDRPKNVIIRKWMPQSSILAHPNVKLFISHGGLLSCLEATYFGVPLLAIPIFGDQYHNAKTMYEKEQGIMLTFDSITEASLTSSIKETITNPKYTQNAKKYKEIFHDRPMKPRDLLAYYVNHVIRTNGAKYLSPPSLPRCSQLLLDVAVVILTPLVLVMLLFVFVCRKLCCRSKSKQVNKGKKNK
ncbi:UDP-glucosyltransferase 2-like [Arctopsyche grandis]|uniref:UDP-glucosyltransferase 2-like n=1 Tax=Arctopsyche grandis TaxID=121162 RepID=UPI00406D8073